MPGPYARTRSLIVLLSTLACALTTAPAAARPSHVAASGGASPAGATAASFVSRIAGANRIALTVTNYGFLGNNFVDLSSSLEYPGGSGIEHLPRAGLWVGAHARDAHGPFTGVTTGCLDGELGVSGANTTEFTPVWSAIVQPAPDPGNPGTGSVSNADLLARYDDLSPRMIGVEPHRPLGVEVHQSLYQWSWQSLADVAVCRFTVVNRGDSLRDLWVGLYTEFESGPKYAYTCWPPQTYCGGSFGSWFEKSWVQFDDSLRLVREHYCAALPVPSGCDEQAVPPWIGLELLTPPAPGQHVTVAGWRWDPTDTTRDRDVQRYALMSAGTVADFTQSDLMPDTGDPVELTALGPFPLLAPGDSLTVDFAFVGGMDLTAIRANAALAQQLRDAAYQAATPTLLSLLSLTADDAGVHALWSGGSPGLEAQVQRTGPGQDWTTLGTVVADASGALRYDDAGVSPGVRYGYRLMADGQALAEAWIDVPARAAFAVRGTRPSPVAGGPLRVALDLDAAGPVRIELLDPGGRRVRSLSWVAPGSGRFEVPLGDAAGLAPGVYLLRATRGERIATARAIVMR